MKPEAWSLKPEPGAPAVTQCVESLKDSTVALPEFSHNFDWLDGWRKISYSLGPLHRNIAWKFFSSFLEERQKKEKQNTQLPKRLESVQNGPRRTPDSKLKPNLVTRLVVLWSGCSGPAPSCSSYFRTQESCLNHDMAWLPRRQSWIACKLMVSSCWRLSSIASETISRDPNAVDYHLSLPKYRWVISSGNYHELRTILHETSKCVCCRISPHNVDLFLGKNSPANECVQKPQYLQKCPNGFLYFRA